MKLNEIRDLYDRARSEEVALFVQASLDFNSAGLDRFTGRTVRVCVDGVPCTCVGTHIRPSEDGDGAQPEYRLAVKFDGDGVTECDVDAFATEFGDLLNVVEFMNREVALYQKAVCQ